MLGGTLISLSLRFPQESKHVELRPWLLAVPYGISLVLAAWGITAMNSLNPWAYIPSRYAIYLYGIGVFGFLGTMFYRARSGDTATTRRQAHRSAGQRPCVCADHVLVCRHGVQPRFSFDIALLLPPLIIFPLWLHWPSSATACWKSTLSSTVPLSTVW